MSAEALIDCQGLGRRFGTRVAVESLSFQLGAGRILALLGPNGAGKTTSMRMLAGLLAPSAGSARVCAHPLGADERANAAIRARCGVVPEAPGFYERLTALDNLRFFGGLHGLDASRLERRCREELGRFGLAGRGQDRVGAYSKGMKQRLALARALLHEPSLLFLDEPTAGLDPRATLELQSLILAMREQGCGIVLSTHSLEEAEAMADDILVLDTRVLFHGPPAALLPQEAEVYELRMADAADPEVALPPGCRLLEREAGRWLLAVEHSASANPELLRRLAAAGIAVVELARRRSALRQRYLALLDRDPAKDGKPVTETRP